MLALFALPEPTRELPFCGATAMVPREAALGQPGAPPPSTPTGAALVGHEGMRAEFTERCGLQ